MNGAFLLPSVKHFGFKLFLLGLGILTMLSSCTLHRLEIQTQYLSHENLASHHIGTPDPALYHPLIGQRLLVQWSLCAQEVESGDLFLYLRVRFRNHREENVKIPITSKKGTYLYVLANEDYCQSGGILTYNAEIRNETCAVASWKHPLWAELIKFDFPAQGGQDVQNIQNLQDDAADKTIGTHEDDVVSSCTSCSTN